MQVERRAEDKKEGEKEQHKRERMKTESERWGEKTKR